MTKNQDNSDKFAGLRRPAQAELQVSNRRFRALIEHSADVVATLAADGTVLYVSPAVSRVLGYQPEEMVGHSAFEWLHPDHQATVADIFGQVLQQPGAPFSLEVRFRAKDGKWRWFSGTGVNLLAEPSVQAIVVNYRDITERKQAEEQLRESEERFGRAFHLGPAGVTITRISDGKFVDANEAFLRMFEFEREDVIGHTSTELKMWSFEERNKLIERQLATGGLRTTELVAKSKSGVPITILFSSNPIELNGESHHITVMVNITERKRAEAQLNEQLDELRRWHTATLGREGRILELKREVNELLAQAGQPPRYPSAEADSSGSAGPESGGNRR